MEYIESCQVFKTPDGKEFESMEEAEQYLAKKAFKRFGNNLKCYDRDQKYIQPKDLMDMIECGDIGYLVIGSVEAYKWIKDCFGMYTSTIEDIQGTGVYYYNDDFGWINIDDEIEHLQQLKTELIEGS